MSVIIKEIFMDWLDINEFHNVRIDSKSKCYTDTLSCDEEFYLMAKTNADDGDAVEIHLNLLDKNQAILKTIELESHVENEEVKITLKIEDLAKENLLDFNAIKEINAEFHYENEKYPTNKARVCRTLKSKELSDSSELNDIVECKVVKAYKKGKGTVPNSKGDEVKLIQTSLQKMKINIGDDGVDGLFGNDGHDAVMTFQENYKPTHNVHQYTWGEPDGIVGKNTLLAMDEALISGWKLKIVDIIKFKVDKHISLENRPYEITLSTGAKIFGTVDKDNIIKNTQLPEGEHEFKFTLPTGSDRPVKNTISRVIRGMTITDETRDIVVIKNTINEIEIKYTTYTYEPPKKDFNKGLTSASNSYMKEILGEPSDKYSTKCSELTSVYKKKVKTASIGPFRVTGFKLAVESLKDIFKDIKSEYPDLYNNSSSAGMLCSRYVRGSSKYISNHSWGTALDLKLYGKLDSYGDGKVQQGLLVIAKAFNKHQWYWGVHFRKEDGMHFEVSKEKLEIWKKEKDGMHL